MLSLLLLTFTPIVFSIRNADYIWAARICEQFVVIIGVIILVPLFSPEEEGGIRETVESKYTPQSYVYIIRILTSLLIIVGLITLIVELLILWGGSFNQGALIAGSFATAFFLGALGMFVVSVSGQLMAGYMVPIVYFILDMMTKGKYTKKFFLFSLLKNSFIEKYYLLAAALVLVVMSLLAYIVKKNRR